MHSYIFSVLLSTVALGLAFPAAAPQQRPVEQNAWEITNFVAFTAAAGRNMSSYLSFDFRDTNSGLEMSTCCERSVAPGESLSDPNAYYGCDNQTVLFQYSGAALGLQRTYYDPFLGPPPFDHETAFGSAATNFRNHSMPAGVIHTMRHLNVPITALAGK